MPILFLISSFQSILSASFCFTPASKKLKFSYASCLLSQTSTLSSLGTVYSPPWDTTIATRLIKEVPAQSTHKMLPDMNIRERIEYWQQANNTYYNSNNMDETVSSVEKNSLGNSSSQMDMHQPQQDSSQQPLLHHQQKVHTKDSVIKVHQVLHCIIYQ